MSFRLNTYDQYESLGTFKFSNFPRVWEAKSQELVDEKLAENIEEARKMCANWEFELELYYEKEYGVFAVECDAVDSGTIWSPYSRELGKAAED